MRELCGMQNVSNLGNLLENMVGPWGLEPQTWPTRSARPNPWGSGAFAESAWLICSA